MSQIGIAVCAAPDITTAEETDPASRQIKQIRIEKVRQEFISPEDFKQAVGLYKERKFNEAFNRFDAMGHKGKNHDQVHYYIGLCCQQMNQLVRAKNEFSWVYHNTRSPRLRYNSQIAWSNATRYQNNRTYKGQGNVFARYSRGPSLPPKPDLDAMPAGGGG